MKQMKNKQNYRDTVNSVSGSQTLPKKIHFFSMKKPCVFGFIEVTA